MLLIAPLLLEGVRDIVETRTVIAIGGEERLWADRLTPEAARPPE
jgi:hypothetical protein